MRNMQRENIRRVRREDFALENVPDGFRGPRTSGLFAVMLAIPSALVFLSVGGALESAYGTGPLVVGLLVAGAIIGVAGWILTGFARQSGLDSDLISIVAGYGKLGSGVTSAIYSANFLILFAIEDSIVAAAIHHRYPSIPKAAVLVALGLVVVVLTWHGVSVLARAMTITLPLMVAAFAIATLRAHEQASPHTSFWSYTPGSGPGDVPGWLAVSAALLAFVVNATVAADVGRFLPQRPARVGQWLFGGALQIISFGGATLLGAWLTWRLRGDSDPGVYLPTLLGGWGLACVVLSQTRINIINAYSGSLSLSNFAARLFGSRPGRHVWMATLVVAGTILASGDIYAHLLGVLTFEAVFVVGWVATLTTYIVVAKPQTRRQSRGDDIRSAPRFNPIGSAAHLIALAVAVPLAFGAAGPLGRALAPLTSLGLAALGVYVGVAVDRARIGGAASHRRS